MRIAADMRTSQTSAQQKAKPLGEHHERMSKFDAGAHQYGIDRLAQGYGINDVDRSDACVLRHPRPL
jgi:hypothetical protein